VRAMAMAAFQVCCANYLDQRRNVAWSAASQHRWPRSSSSSGMNAVTNPAGRQAGRAPGYLATRMACPQ